MAMGGGGGGADSRDEDVAAKNCRLLPPPRLKFDVST